MTKIIGLRLSIKPNAKSAILHPQAFEADWPTLVKKTLFHNNGHDGESETCHEYCGNNSEG